MASSTPVTLAFALLPSGGFMVASPTCMDRSIPHSYIQVPIPAAPPARIPARAPTTALHSESLTPGGLSAVPHTSSTPSLSATVPTATRRHMSRSGRGQSAAPHPTSGVSIPARVLATTRRPKSPVPSQQKGAATPGSHSSVRTLSASTAQPARRNIPARAQKTSHRSRVTSKATPKTGGWQKPSPRHLMFKKRLFNVDIALSDGNRFAPLFRLTCSQRKELDRTAPVPYPLQDGPLHSILPVTLSRRPVLDAGTDASPPRTWQVS